MWSVTLLNTRAKPCFTLSTVKQEPLDVSGSYTYPSEMTLDQGSNLGYTASLFLSSSSTGGSLPPTITATVTSAHSSTEVHHTLNQAGRGLQEDNVALSSVYRSQDVQLPNSLQVVSRAGDGPIRVVCGDLDMEGKELAKLQTVQMDDDGSDLWWDHWQWRAAFHWFCHATLCPYGPCKHKSFSNESWWWI